MMSEHLRICFLSAEVAPYAKVGGLADVAGSLPKAIRAMGHEVILVLPRYGTVDEAGLPIERAEVSEVTVRVAAESFRLEVGRGMLPGSDVPIYFLDNPRVYGGGVYADPETGDPYPDNLERFLVFSLGSLELLRALDWHPDVLHLNDNHVGLVPLYLNRRYAQDRVLMGAATVITIHNLAYQGDFAMTEFPRLGLPEALSRPGSSLEWRGRINMLKAGLVESDVINTVSENYAREIQTEEYGAGLDGVLRARRDVLHGILNGADYSVWDPRVDSLIPHRYGPDRMVGKGKNKAALCKSVDLPIPGGKDIPLIGLVTRLVEQKGFDIIESALPALLEMDIQMVILGTGEDRYERYLAKTAEGHPDKLAVRLAFDNKLAHLIEAGSDMFLMASRFEPSGLNQIYSLRYGTVPIVRATGGLADTVVDDGDRAGLGTGFVFQEYSPAALVEAIRRAVVSFKDPAAWRALVARGMRLDFSWDASAGRYVQLYRRAIELARERVKLETTVE